MSQLTYRKFILSHLTRESLMLSMLHQFKIYHEYEMRWKNSLPFDESGGITPCNPWIASVKTPWWAALWGVTYENKKKNERKLICVLKLKNIIFIHSSSAKIFEEEVTLPTSPTPFSRGALKILILLLRIFLILFSNQRHVSQKSR